MSNPLMFNAKHQSTPPKYPIEVWFIYQEPFNRNDQTLATLREFCSDLNIDFHIRPYNADLFREDRDEIERLPALHLFEKKVRKHTFYPNGRPIQIILDSFTKFRYMEKEKLEAKEKWANRYETLKSFFSLKTDSKLSKLERMREK